MYVYIYMCATPPSRKRSTFFTVFFLPPPIPTLKHIFCAVTLACWRCRKKNWEDGKKHVFKAFDLKKNVVTGKCCLQVASALKPRYSLK